MSARTTLPSLLYLSRTFSYSLVGSFVRSFIRVYVFSLNPFSFYFVTLFTFIHISFYSLFSSFPLLLIQYHLTWFAILCSDSHSSAPFYFYFLFVFLFCSTSLFPYSIALAPTSFAAFFSFFTSTHPFLLLCPRSFARFVDIVRFRNIP